MKKALVVIALSFLSCASGFAAVLSGMFFLPLALASTVFFSGAVLLSGSSGIRSLLVIPQSVVGITVILYALLTDNFVTAMVVLTLFFPAGFSVGTALNTKKNLNSAGAWALLSGGILSVLTFLLYAFDITYPDFSVKDASDTLIRSVGGFISGTLNAANIAEVIPLSQIDTESLGKMILTVTPAVIAVWFLLSTAVSYLFVRVLFGKAGNDISFADGFTGFRVSRAGAIFYFIVTLIALFADHTVISVICTNYTMAASLVFAYAGVSLIGFYMNFKNWNIIVKIVIYAVIFAVGLSPFGLSVLLSFLGILDSYIDIRARFENSGI